MLKLAFAQFTLVLVIMCCLKPVSSFSGKGDQPRLTAEMSVYKHQEKLKFEKNIQFSPNMIGDIAQRIITFCLAVCPGVNKDVANRFLKKLRDVSNKYEISIENDEIMYAGYEKAFKNCLLTRYLKAFGYGLVTPEPDINIFSIKRSDKVNEVRNAWKVSNVTIFALRNNDKRADEDESEEDNSEELMNIEETENNSNFYDEEDAFNDEPYFEDDYDSKELDTLEYLFETATFNPMGKHSLYLSRNTVNTFINRLIGFFKVAVGLFYEHCQAFYKPYTNFWETFITSLKRLFEENTDSTLSLVLYLHYKPFYDELNKCGSKAIPEQLFPNYFELGKIFEVQ